MRRTSVVELVVDEDAVEKLKLICSLSSNLWNEVNYVRRRMLFGKRGVDLRDTYREFYEKYKLLIGSATAQQVLNKKDEAWKSFFKLLKLKKEGMLPPFINKVNPLGYRKKNNRRTLWAVLRKDQYRMEGDKIVLKGLCGPRENRTRLQGFNTLEGRGWRYTMTQRGRSGIHMYPSRQLRRPWEEGGLVSRGSREATLLRA